MRYRTKVLGFYRERSWGGKKHDRRASFEVEVAAPLQRAVFILVS